MAFPLFDKLHASKRTFIILLALFLTTLVLADEKCNCKSPSTKVCKEACEQVNSSIDWVGALHKVTAVAGAASTLFGLYAAVHNHNQNNAYARHQAYMAQQEQQKQVATYNNKQRKGDDDGEWDWLVPLLGFGAQLLAG